MPMEAYLDNAATTKPSRRVVEKMQETFTTAYGNPSSLHRKGVEAERYVKEAQKKIAHSLKAKEKEIIFTSGGTESNNMALLGTVLANARAGKRIVSSNFEHASIYNPLGFLETQGYEVAYVPVDSMGHMKKDALLEAVTPDTLLLSVMMVNNEVGSLLDVEEIGREARTIAPGLIFHVDAIQGYGKYRIFPERMGIDLLSVSGHKIHGPKGSGFLYARESVKLSPILFGGGQQKGMRSGTENVPAIAGLGEAVQEIYENHEEKREHLYQLKEYFINEILTLPMVQVNAVPLTEGRVTKESVRTTAPHVVSVSFQGIPAEVLLHALEEKGIYVSSGSACSSNHPALSGTLKAIGVPEEYLGSTLRFSFSVNTTKEELDYALENLQALLGPLRKFTRK